MATLSFEDLSFENKGDKVRIHFLKLFYFDVAKEELQKIAKFSITGSEIDFKGLSENKAERKFMFLLERGFKELKNKIDKKDTIYIHRNSGIPLIGHIAFGIIDRGTNIIEVKPETSCNIKCIYCSVDDEKRPVDFVVEEEYLADELRKVIEYKEDDDIEIHIASQGEPTLYPRMVQLVALIRKIPQVKRVSIDTNGTLLTKKYVDELAAAGLTHVNLSINAMEKDLARKIAGTGYNVEKIKEIAEYLSKKVKLLIAPVLLNGVNEQEMPKIIQFAKHLNARIGIQNFLNYRFGRNPVKQITWDDFTQLLKGWEKEFNVKLLIDASDFNIRPTKELPKPFRKGEILKLNAVLPGRLKNEKIAIARERIISIPNCDRIGPLTARITRTKHNIFMAEIV
ncbi:MAG TPA: radical SAM protein [Candidatus Nanoarchaeia archaeon]|nr:radical SAM protein [Candidatus Nanoarchaeia archaeon]